MRFYQIQIGTIYLTSDGASTGTPCKLEVPNWEDLLTTVAGNIRPNADGSPDVQTYAWSEGKQFDIKIEVLNQAQWESLKTLLNDSNENNHTFTVIGTGDTGNFSVTARAFVEKPFSAQSFRNGRINGVNLRLITA